MKERPEMTRHAIFARAIEHLRNIRPTADPVSVVASHLNKSPQTIYSYLSGTNCPTAVDIERLFMVCDYPQGFTEWMEFVFPEATK